MPVSVATFKSLFPEFEKATTTHVQAALDAALLELDPDIWTVKIDEGQKYLAAHKLALSPFGQNARLILTHGQARTTTYWSHYRALQKQVAIGFRVA